MTCAYHDGRPAQGVCSICGRAVCEECLVLLEDGAYCHSCLDAQARKPEREINGTVRFVLSIAPGLGHLYLGLFMRGLQFMVATILGVGILNLLLGSAGLAGLYIPAMIFFSIFDAREAHLRMSQGLEVEDKGFVEIKNWQFQWSNRYIGYGLIGIGALFLYRTLVRDLLRAFILDPVLYNRVANSIEGITVGVLAIVAGVWLLRRKDAGPDE